MDLEDIERVRADLRFRGAQGTTGTQASFMEIFEGDEDKIDRLNEILCEKAGFERCYSISTQTYTRKVDLRVANALSAFGATVQKITGDIRHLAAQKEMGMWFFELLDYLREKMGLICEGLNRGAF